MALVGIDVGGTGVKAVAYSEKGAELKQAYREYSMKNPETGVYVFDPQAIYQAAESVLKEVTFGCGEEVLGIGCSSIGESFICLDEIENVLCDSIMYFDTRGGEDVKEFLAKWPAEVLHKFESWPPSRINSIIKMRVMSRENPGFFSRVKRIRMLPDFILSRLGAGHVCDESIAATVRAHNTLTSQWIPEMFEWAGLDYRLMPKIIPLGAEMGEVPERIAKEIGVKPGAKLVSGGHDHTAASIGVGLTRVGQLMNEIGTVDFAMMLIGDSDLPKLRQPDGSRIGFRRHLGPGTYAINAGGGGLTGGAILRWFRDHFGLLEKAECERIGADFYAEYNKKFPKEPTDLIVLPQFGTGLPGRDHTGAILNMTMSTTNEQIYRAFMECETFAVYTGLKYVNDNIREVEDVIALGGGARSADYMQIRSDVFNAPVKTVNSDQAGTHGDAMLAGVAVGVWKDIEEAIEASVQIKETFEPNQKNHAYYMEMYEKYLRVYEAVNNALFPLHPVGL